MLSQPLEIGRRGGVAVRLDVAAGVVGMEVKDVGERHADL